MKLAKPGAPTGRPLQDDEKVEVLWTVDAGPEDEAIRSQRGKVYLRRYRILRLLQEAHAQGRASYRRRPGESPAGYLPHHKERGSLAPLPGLCCDHQRYL